MSHILHKILYAGLETGPNAVALFDPQDRLSFANGVFVDLYQVQRPADTDFAAIMRHCHASKRGLLIDQADIEAWLSGVMDRRRRAPSRTYEADFLDGRWLWVTETLLPDGWLYYNGTDISALKYHESAILRARDAALLAANTDILTGLGNRRVMLESLQHALHGCGTACMIDLDYFKKINDSYGHPVGDRVLQHFAGSTSAQLRPGDQLARIGGEEFLLLLPSTTLPHAEAILRRIRLHLQSDPMLPDIPALRYTFSAGITDYAQRDTVDEVLRRADDALYRAKQAGRDRHAVLLATA